jgi:O-methyltransferase involved in polyketide biosynthesis
MFDPSWMEEIPRSNEPILIVAEGLFMYFTEEELKPLFDRLVENYPDAEMLFEMLAPFLVGKSKNHETVSKINGRAEFKWGLKNSRTMETWNDVIRFKEEWNYFDFHQQRWKWFDKIARLPFIRSTMANRIVHFSFDGQPR